MSETHLLARFGSDEFALLMPGFEVDEAQSLVQRMRSESAALHGFSAGIARWDGVESADLLMARADAALHNSKRAGKGKLTVVAGSHQPAESWSYLIPRLLARHEVRTVYQPIRRLQRFEPNNMVEVHNLIASHLGQRKTGRGQPHNRGSDGHDQQLRMADFINRAIAHVQPEWNEGAPAHGAE